MVIALWLVAGCLVVFYVGIKTLSAPAERDIYVSGIADSLTVPEGVSLSFPHIDSLQLWGVNGSIERLRAITVTSDRPRRSAPISGAVKLIGDASSAIVATPSRSQGGTQFTIPSGTVVSVANDESGLALKLRVATEPLAFESDADQLNMSVSQVSIRVNDCSEAPADHVGIQTESSVRVGQFKGTAREAWVVLRGLDDVPLVPDRVSHDKASPAPSPRGTVDPSRPSVINARGLYHISNFVVQVAAFTGAKDADLVQNAPADLDAQPVGTLSLTSVAVLRGEAHQKPRMLIVLRGKVSSLKQDSREALPSRLSDVLSAEPKTRGLFGAAAVFLIFVGGTIFKRAIDILAKAVLPEAK